MSHKRKIFSALAVFMLVALIIVPTAAAFDGRGDDRIVIEADEVIEDDLYLGAESVVVDGVIKGDLFVGAGTVVINGTVEGDLMVGAQSLVINGTVEDDVRVFGAAIQLGADAVIGDDLLFGGGSLEAKSGSLVSGDMVIGAGQALVAGDTEGDILVGSGAFELGGNVNGSVNAYVDSSTENTGMSPMSFGPSMNISIPYVAPGITLDKDASVGGDLNYTSFETMSFPAGVVAGETLRIEPAYDEYDYDHAPYAPPTPQALAGLWALNLLRTIITLTVIGLVLGWLSPNLLAAAEYKLQTNPMPSLGWGVVAYATFYFALLIVFTAMIIGAIIFGILSLGGLSGTIVILGLLALSILIVGFILTVAYLTKIIVSVLGGKLILARVKPEWVNHKVYPLLVGVVLLSLVMSIPVVGWVFKVIIVLFGLGALWILGREQLGKKDEIISEA